MKTGQAEDGRRQGGRFPMAAESVAFLLIGAMVFVVGRWIAQGSAATSVIQILGAGAIFITPLLWRAEGMLTIGLKGLTINLTAREERRSQAVLSTVAARDENLEAITRVAKASHEALAGILPFLSGDVASGVVMVPPVSKYKTFKLKDENLHFIRQNLQLAVVAIRRPGESQWQAGGVISETPLEAGTELLVCGPASAIDRLREELREA